MACIGWICPSHRNGPHQEHSAGHHTPHDEEDALVHCDLQRSGQLEDTPEDDGAGSPDRPAGFLRDPPTYEEALLSLGRAPTEADLSPQSPESHSSSLIPYATEEDSNPEETQEQQEGTLEQMEAEGQDTTEALVKRGMGENSKDEENDQDEEEDLEALCLAPKLAPSSKPAQNEGPAQIPIKSDQTPVKDLSESELSVSIPELIDLREEGEKPSPFPSQKAQRPTMLKLPVLYSSPPRDLRRDVQEAATRDRQEKVPMEQIIYIDDDMDPSPLQLLQSQVDSLLMPPPSDMTPMVQKSPGRDQLSRMPERRKCSPGNTRKKTLQER